MNDHVGTRRDEKRDKSLCGRIGALYGLLVAFHRHPLLMGTSVLAPIHSVCATRLTPTMMQPSTISRSS